MATRRTDSASMAAIRASERLYFAALRKRAELLFGDFRRMPTANAEAPDRAGGVAFGGRRGDASLRFLQLGHRSLGARRAHAPTHGGETLAPCFAALRKRVGDPLSRVVVSRSARGAMLAGN